MPQVVSSSSSAAGAGKHRISSAPVSGTGERERTLDEVMRRCEGSREGQDEDRVGGHGQPLTLR